MFKWLNAPAAAGRPLEHVKFASNTDRNIALGSHITEHKLTQDLRWLDNR